MQKNDNQDKRCFVINCYKDLYRQGRLSGRGIERHNELVAEYIKDFKNSTMQFLPVPKTIKQDIKTSLDRWFIKRRYENFIGMDKIPYKYSRNQAKRLSTRERFWLAIAGTQ
jgi:hypothetical protein